MQQKKLKYVNNIVKKGNSVDFNNFVKSKQNEYYIENLAKKELKLKAEKLELDFNSS